MGELIVTGSEMSEVQRVTSQPARTMRDQPAGFVSRLIAFVVDLLLISVASIVAGVSVTLILNFFNLQFLTAPPAGTETDLLRLVRIILLVAGVILSFLLVNGYLILFWLLAGQTPGKAFMGLRVVSLDGRPLNVGQAARRLVGYWLAALPLFAGFLWVLVDDERRGWHDKLARTRVIYAWEARMGQRFLDAVRQRRRQLETDGDGVE